MDFEVELIDMGRTPTTLTAMSQRAEVDRLLNSLEVWYRRNLKKLPHDVYQQLRRVGASEHFTFDDAVDLQVDILRVFDRDFAQADGASLSQRIATFRVLRQYYIEQHKRFIEVHGYDPAEKPRDDSSEVQAVDRIIDEMTKGRKTV